MTICRLFEFAWMSLDEQSTQWLAVQPLGFKLCWSGAIQRRVDPLVHIHLVQEPTQLVDGISSSGAAISRRLQEPCYVPPRIYISCGSNVRCSATKEYYHLDCSLLHLRTDLNPSCATLLPWISSHSTKSTAFIASTSLLLLSSKASRLRTSRKTVLNS